MLIYFDCNCITCSHVLDQAKKAMEKDRKKWEEANMEAVQVLEEQNTQRMESMWSEVQRETIKALALQHTVGELKTVR